MNLDLFQNPKKHFSVVLFIQEHEFKAKQPELEALGRQKNIRLVVQPCPYEGIEFLYRLEHDLIGHHVSIEKDVFWHAIELKPSVAGNVISEVSKHHYDYLCGFLEQDAKKVAREGRALESFSDSFA